jgi:putative ABC transport system ATP-binding protein
MNDAISIHDLEFQWPGALRLTLQIPRWQVRRGERVFLYGPSGSGKSTLLNLLAGILAPQRGRIDVLGSSLGSLNNRARDRFRARFIGYIFQQFNLVPYLSVADNVALARHFGAPDPTVWRPTPAQRLQDTLDLLKRLGLAEDLLARRSDTLSVGQQQRVAIVRALVNRPQLIIADEPSSALDSDARDEFLALLLECAALHGSAVVFVSHDRSMATHFDTQVALSSLNLVAGGG